MAFDETKIHVGTARIFFGVTAGATGTPPTYITHTAGVPGSGTEAGLTKDDCTFTWVPTKKLITAEQVPGAVGVYLESESAMFEFTCQESTYNTLKQAFDNVGVDSQAGGDALYFGGGTGILAPRTQCVFVSSIQRNAPTKFLIAVLYKTVSMLGYKVPISRTKESMYKVQLVALEDVSRNNGDYMGYYRWEK